MPPRTSKHSKKSRKRSVSRKSKRSRKRSVSRKSKRSRSRKRSVSRKSKRSRKRSVSRKSKRSRKRKSKKIRKSRELKGEFNHIPLNKYIPFYDSDGYGILNPQTLERYKSTLAKIKKMGLKKSVVTNMKKLPTKPMYNNNGKKI